MCLCVCTVSVGVLLFSELVGGEGSWFSTDRGNSSECRRYRSLKNSVEGFSENYSNKQQQAVSGCCRGGEQLRDNRLRSSEKVFQTNKPHESPVEQAQKQQNHQLSHEGWTCRSGLREYRKNVKRMSKSQRESGRLNLLWVCVQRTKKPGGLKKMILCLP